VAPFDSEGMSRQKSATHAAILVWFMALACGAALAACDRGSEASVRRVIEDHDQLLRDGDGEGYWSLFSRRARQEAGLVGPEALLRLTLVARPERVRTVQSVLVRAHTAAVFTHFVDAGQTHYGADRLVRESGEWRIDRQVVSTTPFTAAYFLPPEGGRFMGAGAPWERVAPITDPEVGRPDQPKASWQLARDEAFVYLRASYAKELPPVGERLEGGATSLDLLGFGPASIEAVITRPMQKPTRVSITFEATAKGAVKFLPERTHVDTLDYTVTVEPHAGGSWTGSLRAEHGGDDGGDQSLFELRGNAFLVKLPLEALGAGPDANVSLEFGPFGHRTRHTSLSF
jgi:hypothetical protein